MNADNQSVFLSYSRHFKVKNITRVRNDFVCLGKVSPVKKLRGGVRFVPAIPKSPAGKILRRIMKDTVRQEQQKQKAKL